MSLLSFDEALAQLLAQAPVVTETESVPTHLACGCILAADLVSSIDVPPLDNSAMDGYAVRCADVTQADTRLAVGQRIAAGSLGQALAPQTAARIFTGAPIPEGADAVVMQEQCSLEAGSSKGAGHVQENGLGSPLPIVTVHTVPRPGQSIRRRGEDIARGAEAIRRGTRLTAAHAGVAASVGAANLEVTRPLRVALFSTGDELTMPGDALKPGGIYNSNRTTLHALLRGLGCGVTDLGIVPDTLAATQAALRGAALGHDLILTSGGVSVGEEDHIKAAVAAEGALDLWKVAIKPGKPFAFGWVGKPVEKVGVGDTAREGAKTPFIGLPGNPVASFVTFLMLVRPFILAMQGAADVRPHVLSLRADFAAKASDRREFLRARMNGQGGLSLYPQQGSAVLTSCAWADGLVDHLPGTVIHPGDSVRFMPFSALDALA
ncbi:MAG: gephyrin-like molybdotransferase Glp [Rugosibacter sp.]|jgi:Molybdopterin biosynthesis enzyme|nr:molybdopterin molybdotransferase [Rugosibacter sp.]